MAGPGCCDAFVAACRRLRLTTRKPGDRGPSFCACPPAAATPTRRTRRPSAPRARGGRRSCGSTPSCPGPTTTSGPSCRWVCLAVLGCACAWAGQRWMLGGAGSPLLLLQPAGSQPALMVPPCRAAPNACSLAAGQGALLQPVRPGLHQPGRRCADAAAGAPLVACMFSPAFRACVSPSLLSSHAAVRSPHPPLPTAATTAAQCTTRSPTARCAARTALLPLLTCCPTLAWSARGGSRACSGRCGGEVAGGLLAGGRNCVSTLC